MKIAFYRNVIHDNRLSCQSHGNFIPQTTQCVLCHMIIFRTVGSNKIACKLFQYSMYSIRTNPLIFIVYDIIIIYLVSYTQHVECSS